MGSRLALTGLLGIAALAITLSVSGQSTRPDMKVLAKTKGGELSAEIPNEDNWCKPDMVFTINGAEDTYFKEGETDDQGRTGRFLLQRLIGVIRVGLQAECPQARSITLNGYVDGVHIFRGYASRSDSKSNWALIEFPINTTTATASTPAPELSLGGSSALLTRAARPASIAECDALAAHPDDPTKPKTVVGVADDDIKAGEASDKCEEAVATDPDSPRLAYQLARAYVAFGKAAEGLELLTEAAEDGHAVAIAYLGDVALYGVLDSTPNPDLARALYLRAEKLGFKPAGKLAAAIQANPEEDRSQSVSSEPEFTEPKRASILLQGKSMTATGSDFLEMMFYSSSFLSGIKHQCPQVRMQISENAVMRSVQKRGAYMALVGFSDGSRQDEIGELKQNGMDDGYALAVTKGCDTVEVDAVLNTIDLSLLN